MVVEKGNNDYKISLYKVKGNYDCNDASWISQNSKGAKWLNQYWEKYGDTFQSYPFDIEVISYLMDTNVWSGYYAGEKAEYAMGAPTIELFCASYKETHPYNYIETIVQSGEDPYGDYARGYGIRRSPNPERAFGSRIEMEPDDFNGIYIKSDSTKVSTMWIASSAIVHWNVMNANAIGSISAGDYGGENGIRPIV